MHINSHTYQVVSINLLWFDRLLETVAIDFFDVQSSVSFIIVVDCSFYSVTAL